MKWVGGKGGESDSRCPQVDQHGRQVHVGGMEEAHGGALCGVVR